jgi:hypothetical protein
MIGRNRIWSKKKHAYPPKQSSFTCTFQKADLDLIVAVAEKRKITRSEVVRILTDYGRSMLDGIIQGGPQTW